MQATSGVAVMGSLQVAVCGKGSCFPSKSSSICVFPQQKKMNILKPCKSFKVEASMVAGKPSSSVSVTVPEIGGEILSNCYDFLEHNLAIGISA